MLYNYENAMQFYICIVIFTYYTHSFKIHHVDFQLIQLTDQIIMLFLSNSSGEYLRNFKKIYLTHEKNRYLLIGVPSYETNHYFQPLAAQIFNISASNSQRQTRLKSNEIRLLQLSVSMSSCSVQAGGYLQGGSPILAFSSHFLPSFIPVNRLACSAGRGGTVFLLTAFICFCTDEY